MQTVIIVVHLMIVLALIGLVLLQKSEGGGLGMGGGGFMSSRGTTNALSRATAILGALFFATSLLLTVLAGSGGSRSILDRSTSVPTGQPAAPAPAGSGNGVLDRLQGPPPAPSTPAPQAPSGPQVPRSN